MEQVFATFGNKLLEIVLPALATAIAGLVVALLQKQLRKINLELTAQQEGRAKEVIRDAIKATEERARRTQMSGADKRVTTLELALSRLPAGADEEDVRHTIDATLPDVRAELAHVPKPSTPATFGRGTH